MQPASNAKWKLILGSRKFWAALVGLAFVLVKAFWPDFPLSEEQVLPIVVILAAYICGVALEKQA